MLELYVIRHGQSESNLKKFACGWAQVNLTEKGYADAKNAGELLKGITFDRIIASDLIRAIQTAQTAIPGCEPEQDPLLREINVGELMYIPVAKCRELYGEPFNIAWDTRDFTPYKGENVPMHYARSAEFMKKMETVTDDRKIAVFCHEGTIKNMLGYVLGADISFYHTTMTNGSVSIFQWDGNLWKLRLWNQV